MNNVCVLEIVWTESGLPRLVGPFDSRAEAEEWARTNVVTNGAWNVAPLTYPYLRKEQT